jgi:hypothetical protein
MQLFESLASELHSAWMQRGRDELAFAELARTTLDRFAPASTVAVDDLFRWLVETDRIPHQFDPRSGFGNFALTVAERDGFHIDVLVWTDSTTAIHQHGFSGAFHVLCGSSLHTLWSFKESRRWSDRLKHGQLAVRATEWLKAGSTRSILPGETMIHSLFHLESPSMTVVVRTPSAAVLSPPLSYERSGLAYDPYFELARVEKVRQLLCMLWASDHPRRVALSEAALRGVDAHSAARIISSIRSQATIETQMRLVDILAGRDAELAELLRETVSRRERDRALVDLRKQTRSPRHRMLLALVLNLPDRASIDLALRQIAPEDSPADWLFDSIRSMHDTPGRQRGRDNLLGLSLNEASEQTIRMLLRGHSVEQVSQTVAGHDDLVEDVRALCSTLSALPVLGPLLEQRLAPEQHVR